MADTKFFAVVTDLGTKEMMEAVAEGRKVNITQFAVGDGGGQYYTPDTAMEGLKNEVWRGGIGACRISEESENIMIAEATIPSDVGGFTIREMAVFDDKNTMIAVCNTPDTTKVKVTDGVVHELLVQMEIVLDNKESVGMLVDPNIVTATKKDLQRLIDRMQWLINSYTKHRYNQNKAYKTGDYCIQDGTLYKCTQNTTGAWDGACWENTEILAELDGMQNVDLCCKCLGDSLTAEQAAAIATGTFKNISIGDYWTINGINYRVAHPDYWLNSGDVECKKHHVAVVPDTCMYYAQMHNTTSGQYESGPANTTEGGYIGTDMYKTGLNQAKTMIINAFGEEHILSHDEILVNAVRNGKPSSYAKHESTVELMNEPMVYGSHFFTAACDGTNISVRNTIDRSQLALFAMHPEIVCNRDGWWIRDVVSDTKFACIGWNGQANSTDASFCTGVRPVFGIC